MVTKQEILTLKGEIRETSKKETKKQKGPNTLAAIIYGPKTKGQALTLNQKEFEKILQQAGESSVIDLEVKSQENKHTVLIHQIQRDPLTNKIIHVDLYQPDLTKKVTAAVPLVMIGIAPAVKDFGGTLIKNFSEIEVKALPMDLPHEIQIDVSELKELHQEIKIKDLKIPAGLEIDRNPEDTIIIVTPPADVEAELAKPVVGEEGKEPELIREKKEEEAETPETTETAPKE